MNVTFRSIGALKVRPIHNPQSKGILTNHNHKFEMDRIKTTLEGYTETIMYQPLQPLKHIKFKKPSVI